MSNICRFYRVALLLTVCTVGFAAPVFSTLAHAAGNAQKQESVSVQASVQETPPQAASPAKPKLDHSGHKRIGKASFYAKKFAGRTMADGTPMRPHSNNAASKTLPLGTIAKVTNLENGQSAVVTIQDRGPYVKGRIVDLSPSTAREIGIVRQGVAKVEVAPIAVPQPDGSIKPGVAAQEVSMNKSASGGAQGS